MQHIADTIYRYAPVSSWPGIRAQRVERSGEVGFTVSVSFPDCVTRVGSVAMVNTKPSSVSLLAKESRRVSSVSGLQGQRRHTFFAALPC